MGSASVRPLKSQFFVQVASGGLQMWAAARDLHSVRRQVHSKKAVRVGGNPCSALLVATPSSIGVCCAIREMPLSATTSESVASSRATESGCKCIP